MGKIVWLASYPKSGGTWLRIFLANYRFEPSQPWNINAPDGVLSVADRMLFEDRVGINAADLSPEWRDHLRAEVLRGMAGEREDFVMVKAHEVFRPGRGVPGRIPAEDVLGVLYVIRHPGDVAVSVADHFGLDLEGAVRRLVGGWQIGVRGGGDFSEELGSWQEHVVAWTRDAGLPLQVLRFEDLLNDPASSFCGAIRLLGLQLHPDRVEQAVAWSDFRELRRQEDQHGFRERSSHSHRFFRSGQSGTWREVLTTAQQDLLFRDAAQVMHRFGYQDEPVG